MLVFALARARACVFAHDFLLFKLRLKCEQRGSGDTLNLRDFCFMCSEFSGSLELRARVCARMQVLFAFCGLIEKHLQLR